MKVILLALMMLFAIYPVSPYSLQTNFDTTDLFLGFRYGMSAYEYLSYLNAIQPNKPITIMSFYPPKCQGVSTPEFSYFGFDFTTRFEPIYCTPDFDEHCKLKGISLAFPLMEFRPAKAPEQDWWSKIKGEKSPQEIADEEAKEREKKYYQNLIKQMESTIQSKYGLPNGSDGVYCWFFGHKKITITKEAHIIYTYIAAPRSKANVQSDL